MESLFQRGFEFHRQGRLGEAEPLYRAALAQTPSDFNALHLLGLLLHQRGLHGQGLALVDKALEIDSRHPSVHLNRGAILVAMGQPERALDSYDRALALNPDYAQALSNRGTAWRALGRHAQALADYEHALRLTPADAEALSNRGVALQSMGRLAEALESYDRALAIRPRYPQALSNRAAALTELGRTHEALQCLDRALDLMPDYAHAHYNRANVLRELGRRPEALAGYRRALALQPDYAECLYNCAALLAELERHEEAAGLYGRAKALGADFPDLPGATLHCRLHCCDWSGFAQASQEVIAGVGEGRRLDTPFSFLAICGSPQHQRRCATAYADDKYPSAPQPLYAGPRDAHARIRLAYLSADFQEHATAYLMAGLFERHDRRRFEVTAISFGADAPSPMRKRLENSFDRFIDVRDRSDREVAQLMLELEVDIAVDLKGYTRHARPGILAWRPAPLQVSYLGYPGTMGARHIDYIIADRHVIPRSHTPCYTEKVVWLPDSYQVNDDKRPIAQHTPARQELGLPRQGFVFCAFNSSYKISPAVFDIWMRVMRAVDGSVLWLLGGNPAAERNLRREAGARGVAPDRLVFAPRIELADHLARHRRADLFVDNLPYNAHTTASDALWAGLPVVTCLGEAFAGRVAASLLHAVGMPELIAADLEAYEALLLKLAHDAPLLAGLRAKLAQNRATCPLFDTDRYRRHIEAAYVRMWERHHQGLPPDHIEQAAEGLP